MDMGGIPRSASSRQPAPGDVVVTKVADRYHIGRVHADSDVLTTIAVLTHRNAALASACRLVTGHQRVFMSAQAGSGHIEIDCAKPH